MAKDRWDRLLVLLDKRVAVLRDDERRARVTGDDDAWVSESLAREVEEIRDAALTLSAPKDRVEVKHGTTG